MTEGNKGKTIKWEKRLHHKDLFGFYRDALWIFQSQLVDDESGKYVIFERLSLTDCVTLASYASPALNLNISGDGTTLATN